MGGLRAVFGEPLVFFEAEGIRGGAGADVDLGLDLRSMENDAIGLDEDVAAGGELGVLGFLENAEDPLARKKQGVADELRAVHSNKGRGAEAAFDGVVSHDDLAGLVLRSRGPEIGWIGGTADVERALSCVGEMTFFDRDMGRSAFDLDACGGGETRFAGEGALGDGGVMATDEIDALAAPSGECAVADGEAVEAGTFDPKEENEKIAQTLQMK